MRRQVWGLDDSDAECYDCDFEVDSVDPDTLEAEMAVHADDTGHRVWVERRHGYSGPAKERPRGD